MEKLFSKKRSLLLLASLIISSGFAILGVMTNRAEYVLIAVFSIAVSFFSSKTDSSEIKVPFVSKRIYGIPNRLIVVGALFFCALLAAAISSHLSKLFPFKSFSIIFWVVSIGLLFAAGIVNDRPQPQQQLKNFYKMDPILRQKLIFEILVVIGITVLALILRVINLDNIPPMFHGDEGEMGMEALRAMGKGPPLSFFGVGWFYFPNLFYYLQAGSILLFGQSVAGLRTVSALFGTACVPFIYLIARNHWGKIAGLIASWLFAVSHFSIQYSRLALNNIESTFFAILSFYLVLSFFSSIRERDITKPEINRKAEPQSVYSSTHIMPLIGLGISVGLAQYMYLGSRLIPVVFVILFIFLIIYKRSNLIQVLIIAFSAMAVFAPLGLFYLQNSLDLVTARAATVSIFHPEYIRNTYGPGVSWSTDAWDIILDQVLRNIRFFLQWGDGSAFYYLDLPAFDPVTAILFWLGLGFLAAKIRRFPEFTLITWFILGFIIAGVLTIDSPNGPRLLLITPVVYISAGIFMQKIWDWFHEFFRRIPGVNLVLGWLTYPMVACLLVMTLMINWNLYFMVYSFIGPGTVPVHLAREIVKDASTNHVYLLGEGDIYVEYGTIRFIAGEGKAKNLRNVSELPSVTSDGLGTIVLVTSSNYQKIQELQSRFPNGLLSYRQDQFGRVLYKTYSIPSMSDP